MGEAGATPLSSDAGELETIPVVVVIASYRRPAYLMRALQSVISQRKVRPLETVVVDDGSQDGTAQVATSFGVRVIEKRPPAGDPKPYPACVAGKRNCPPEDCGGAWGYADLLEILANPAHPQHEEQLEWLGGEFDPEAFSVADADAALAATFRRK